VTYHPPAVLPLRREEVVTGAPDAAELFAPQVVAPTLTVWITVVQDAHSRLHRSPARAELSGGLRAGSPEQRREWVGALAHHGARAMATLRAGGRQERALTWARRYEAVDAGADPDRVWGRFVVELASPEQALALLRAAQAVGG
jgi:hypothetical protein